MRDRPIGLDDVVYAVAKEYSIAVIELPRGGRRATEGRGAAEPRMVCYLLLRELTTMSFPEIGRMFNRHHSTVITGIEALQRKMQKRPQVAARVSKIRDVVVSPDQLVLPFHDVPRAHAPSLRRLPAPRASFKQRRAPRDAPSRPRPDYDKPLNPAPIRSFDCTECGDPYVGPNMRRCDRCVRRSNEPEFAGRGTRGTKR